MDGQSDIKCKARCADCRHHGCYTRALNCTGIAAGEAVDAYSDEDRRLMEAAAWVEGTYYSNVTRLEEIALFAQRMGYRVLGLAFCIGLNREARLIARYYTLKGFDCLSVCCKNCSVPKSSLELTQVRPELEHEAMCNPVMQARILADKGAELFISCGLCVGHDALFNKSCPGPVTSVAVKDRLLAHNPLGAVYSRYWRRKLGIQDEDEV